jgi:hypothetical protein
MTVMQRFLATAAIMAATTTQLSAHDFEITTVRVEFTDAGRFLVDVLVDVDALALGVSPATPSAELAAMLQQLPLTELQAAIDNARATMARRVRLRFDEIPVDADIDFKKPEPQDESTEPTVLGIHALLTGPIPTNAKAFRFSASRAFGVVRLETVWPSGASSTQLLQPGERSPALSLTPPRASAFDLFQQYVRLGFLHIVPAGADHVLFVVGLFLLSTQLKPLIWQVTVFTIAHSVTLALASFDIITLTPSIVEPLIALSIVFIGVENIRGQAVSRRRLGIVFLVGLVHGLGFAGILGELGLPDAEWLPALAGFNVGVECGQLTVIAIAALIVGRFVSRPNYRSAIVIPASAAIVAIGSYWTLARLIS